MHGRKFACILGILVMLAMLVTACAPPAAPAPVAPAAPAAEEAAPAAEEAGPTPGGTLTMAFMSTIQDTGDLHRSSSSHSAFIAGHALDTLIRKNPFDGSYHPGLAKSWEVAEDGKSITLKLRDDVTFHDGTPFNAEAVAFNLNRIATLPEAKGMEAYSSLSVGNLYETTEAIDDFTVKVSFNAPYARMVDILSTNQVGGIHSPTAIEEYGDAYGTDALVGTGPFKFVEWTGPLGEISFVRNEDYNWAPEIYKHEGPAYLDGFVIKGIVEPGTRRSALESGSVDVAYLQSSDLKAFEGVAGFNTWLVPKQGTSRIFNFNIERPFLKDIRVRQAFAHAIDREGLVNSPTFGGVDKPAYAFLSAATWGESTDQFKEFNYLYDPEKAAALLDEVGWKDEDGDGIREAHGVEGVEDGTPLVLVEAANANVREQSVVVQGMLNKVGIQTDMVVNDYATMAGLRRAGEYDFTIMSNSGSHFWLIQDFFHSREIGGSNYARYSNPQVDAWFDESAGTVDLARQRELFTMIQKQMLQDIPAFPGWDIVYAWAMKDTVHDITIDSSAVGAYLYDVWLDK